jgi:hypothetical protein
MQALKKCCNWRALALLSGLAVAALLVGPNLVVGVMPVLLVLVCPLSMLLMMMVMGGLQTGHRTQAPASQQPLLNPTPASRSTPTTVSADEQLARLRRQVRQLGEEQTVLGRKINDLERDRDRSAGPEPAPVAESAASRS